MSRGVSQHLPRHMETAIPPPRPARPPYPTTNYDFKPLPPPPIPYKSERRWSSSTTALRRPSVHLPPSPDDVSSIYSQETPLAPPPQTWTFFSSSRTSLASDPRPPLGLGITQFPNQSDAGFPRGSPFEAAPSSMSRVSVTASDMYHATTAHIARTTSREEPATQETGGRKGAAGRLFSREGLSFASRVLQTGKRKQPPARVRTDGSYAPGVHPERTPYPGADGAVEEGPRTGGSTYSQALSRVFGRRGSRQLQAEEKPRRSGGSGIWYSDDDDEDDDDGERFIPTFSRRASGPDTPRPLTQKTGAHWNELMAHAKRAAWAVRLPKQERRRAALRAKIRVIPEGS